MNPEESRLPWIVPEWLSWFGPESSGLITCASQARGEGPLPTAVPQSHLWRTRWVAIYTCKVSSLFFFTVSLFCLSFLQVYLADNIVVVSSVQLRMDGYDWYCLFECCLQELHLTTRDPGLQANLLWQPWLLRPHLPMCFLETWRLSPLASGLGAHGSG